MLFPFWTSPDFLPLEMASAAFTGSYFNAAPTLFLPIDEKRSLLLKQARSRSYGPRPATICVSGFSRTHDPMITSVVEKFPLRRI
jgi:hypothetical protein